MKKRLSPVAALVLLLIALLPMMGSCSAATAPTSATLYGEGTEQMTAAAKAADAAVAGITRSTNIMVPSTIEGGKLFVGSDSSYPPLEYLAKVITAANKDGVIQPVGFEIDLAGAVAKKLGLEVTFTTIDWDDLATSLDQGKIDMVASGMVTGTDLLASLSASNTYLSADLAICTKAGVRLADDTALKGKRVAVQEGSTAQAVIAALDGVGAPKTYPRVQGAFADLKDGKLDAVVVEQPVADWILRTGYAGALTVSGTIKTEQGYAFWCKKDNAALVAAINAALQELRQAPEVVATTTTLSATATTTAGATTTTVLATDTTAGATTTTVGAQQAKSVYQLLCDKWGVTGN